MGEKKHTDLCVPVEGGWLCHGYCTANRREESKVRLFFIADQNRQYPRHSIVRAETALDACELVGAEHGNQNVYVEDLSMAHREGGEKCIVWTFDFKPVEGS